MGIVKLEGLEFFAYHGVYDEEQKIGNKYSVDVSVLAPVEEAATTDKLANTIDYEVLYKLVRHEMTTPARLLEHIGQRIIQSVLEHFAAVKQVEVTVSKYNPPIGGVCHRASVTLVQERK